MVAGQKSIRRSLVLGSLVLGSLVVGSLVLGSLVLGSPVLGSPVRDPGHLVPGGRSGTHGPGTRDFGPATQDQRPGTRDFWPGTQDQRPGTRDSGRPARIVSLVPAVTEMLFAIGAGPQVVAVSSFDDYPPQVRHLERVGALLDPDLERMLALKPDLVIVYATQTDLQRQLQRANVETYTYKHAGLADVAATIRDLGLRTGHAADADRAAAAIDSGIDDLRRRTAGRPRPRTLLVIGREPQAIRGVFASGGVGFLHDVLEAAGGENIFADVRRQAVQASSELILSRRPDVIIELRAGEIPEEQRRKEIQSWERLTALPAVQSGRLHFITDPRTVIPGPRVAEGAEIIARVLHPEAFK